MAKKINIRKLIMIVFVVALVLVYGGGGVLVACNSDKEQDPATHTHNWLAEWDSNAEEHWHNCEGCDEHTGTAAHEFDNDQDANCNVCGYVRHVHSLKWEGNSEDHWQVYTCEHHADEQLNKGKHVWGADGKCKECQLDKNDFHGHTYEWKYDEAQHWQMTTCSEHAPEMSSEGKQDHNFVDGECECGLKEVYTSVYALYVHNQEYKGEAKDDFAVWYTSLSEDDVDHVGLNGSGDGVFYYAKADAEGEYNEEVKYFAERTVSVSSIYTINSMNKIKIQNVWFVVKAKVGGEYVVNGEGKQVLAIGKTDANGVVELNFTPVWGFSGGEGDEQVEYVVELAKDTDIIPDLGVPIPLPRNHKIDVNSKSVSVTASGIGSVEFNVTPCLGTGDGGQIENRVYNSEYTKFELADEVKANPGWYVFKMTTTKGAITGTYSGSTGNIYISVSGGESPIYPNVIEKGDIDKGGAEAEWMVYIDSATTDITLHHANQISVNIICTVQLDKADTVIDAYDTVKTRVNNSNVSTDESKWFKLDISALEAGSYYIFGAQTNDNVKIGEKDAVPWQSSEQLFEIEEGDEQLALYLAGSVGATVRNIRLVPQYEVPDGGEFDIQFEGSKNIYYYHYTVASSGTYSIKLTSEQAFSQVSVRNGSSTIIAGGANEATSLEGNFSCESGKDYIFIIESRGNFAGSIHCAIEAKAAENVTVGEEFEIKFDDVNLQHYYVGNFAKGVYVALLTSSNMNGVTLHKGNDRNDLIAVDSDVAYASSIFTVDSDGDVNFMAQFGGSENYPSVKAIFVKVDEGATEAHEKEEFVINFADKKIAAYQFTYTESAKKYFGVVASSESDIKDLAIYSANYRSVDGDAYNTSTIVDPSTATTKNVGAEMSQCFSSYSSSYSSDYQKAILVFVYAGTGSPSVTAKYQERIYISGPISRDTSRNIAAIKIDHSKVKNGGADKYTLYEAFQPSGADDPTESDYHAIYTYYATESCPETYQNTTYLDSGTLHYYLYCEDTTGNKLPTSTQDCTVPVDGSTTAPRKAYTVTVNFDDTWQGWIGFQLYSGTSLSATNYIKVAEPTKTVEFKIVALARWSTLSVKLADIKNLDNDYYKFSFPADGETNKVPYEDDATNVTIEATVRQPVDVTVTIPENFSETSFPVALYHDGVLFSTKNVLVEPGKTVYNVTVYAPKPQSGTDTIKIYTDTNNGTNGYSSNEDTVAYAGGKGTAAITIKDRVQLKLKLKFPENFLEPEFESNPSQSYTFSIYIYGQDGRTQVNIIKSGAANNPERFVIDKAFVDQLKSNNYEYEFTSAVYYMQNGSYSVEITASQFSSTKYRTGDKVPFSTTTTTAEVELTAVKDRILVTVNVEAYETFGESAQLQAFKGDGNGNKTGSALSLNGSTTTTVPLEKVGDLMKGSFTFYTYEGEYTQILIGLTGKSEADWSYTPVVIEGKTGTATFTIGQKYTISVKGTFKGPSGTSVTLYVYKNGVKIEDPTVTADMSSVQPNKTIYLPAAEYDSSASYELRGVAKPSGYECKAVPFTIDGATKKATVEYNVAAKINFTVELPDDADSFAGANDKKVEVYLNDTGMAKMSKVSLDLATTLTGSFNYLYTDTLTITCICTDLTGNPIFGDPAKLSENTTKYLAEAEYSWDDAHTVCTVTIKPKRADYEITVKGTLTQEFIDSASALSAPMTLELYQDDVKKASYKFIISEDAQLSFEGKAYVWDLEEGYTAKFNGVPRGFTISVDGLTVDADAKTGEINITLTALQAYTVHIENTAGEYWTSYTSAQYSNIQIQIWDGADLIDDQTFNYSGEDPSIVFYLDDWDESWDFVFKFKKGLVGTDFNLKGTVSVDKESHTMTVTISKS